MSDLTEMLAAVNQQNTGYALFREEALTWFVGPADGGPNDDGKFYITPPGGGDPVLAPSPLRLFAMLDAIGPTEDIELLADNVASVNAVGGAIGDVIAVAAGLDDIATIIPALAAIGTVSTNIANVNAVGGSIANVDAVAGGLSNIGTVVGALSNIATVAGVATAVAAVGAGIASVEAVATDLALGEDSLIAQAPQAAADAAEAATMLGQFASIVHLVSPDTADADGDLLYYANYLTGEKLYRLKNDGYWYDSHDSRMATIADLPPALIGQTFKDLNLSIDGRALSEATFNFLTGELLDGLFADTGERYIAGFSAGGNSTAQSTGLWFSYEPAYTDSSSQTAGRVRLLLDSAGATTTDLKSLITYAKSSDSLALGSWRRVGESAVTINDLAMNTTTVDELCVGGASGFPVLSEQDNPFFINASVVNGSTTLTVTSTPRTVRVGHRLYTTGISSGALGGVATYTTITADLGGGQFTMSAAATATSSGQIIAGGESFDKPGEMLRSDSPFNFVGQAIHKNTYGRAFYPLSSVAGEPIIYADGERITATATGRPDEFRIYYTEKFMRSRNPFKASTDAPVAVIDVECIINARDRTITEKARLVWLEQATYGAYFPLECMAKMFTEWVRDRVHLAVDGLLSSLEAMVLPDDINDGDVPDGGNGYDVQNWSMRGSGYRCDIHLSEMEIELGPFAFTGSSANGSQTITITAIPQGGLAQLLGRSIVGPGINGYATITAVGSSTITISRAASSSSSGTYTVRVVAQKDSRVRPAMPGSTQIKLDSVNHKLYVGVGGSKLVYDDVGNPCSQAVPGEVWRRTLVKKYFLKAHGA